MAGRGDCDRLAMWGLPEGHWRRVETIAEGMFGSRSSAAIQRVRRWLWAEEKAGRAVRGPRSPAGHWWCRPAIPDPARLAPVYMRSYADPGLVDDPAPSEWDYAEMDEGTMPDFSRSLAAARSLGTVLLLCEGGERQGKWDGDRMRWVSTIDPRVTLRPVAWRLLPVPQYGALEMPGPAA